MPIDRQSGALARSIKHQHKRSGSNDLLEDPEKNIDKLISAYNNSRNPDSNRNPKESRVPKLS